MKAIRPLERPPALFESVKESIKTYILENQLQAGDPLPPETELAAQLGVSRNSVRKQLGRLSRSASWRGASRQRLLWANSRSESLLDNLPYVLMSSLQDLADLFEIRHTLEAAMIGTAIANLTQGQVEQLQYLVECMRQSAGGRRLLSGGPGIPSMPVR